jgi:hypothetical protein
MLTRNKVAVLFGAVCINATYFSQIALSNTYSFRSSGGAVNVQSAEIYYTGSLVQECFSSSYNEWICQWKQEVAGVINGSTGSCPNQYHLQANVILEASGNGGSLSFDIPVSGSSSDEGISFSRWGTTKLNFGVDKNEALRSRQAFGINSLRNIRSQARYSCKYHGY